MGHIATPGLAFRVDSGSGVLWARFDPTGGTPPSVDEVRKALAEQGHAGCYLDEAAVAGFVGQCATASVAVEGSLGECRDGSFHIEISPDRMSVWLSLVPPQGGKPVTGVAEALQAQGVSFGLRLAALNTALSIGQCHRELIAQGEAPQPPTPTRFESLLPSVRSRRPQVDTHGVVDYRNLGQILIVHSGDALMRRVPAVPGKPGRDVTGQPVPVPDAADIPWSSTLSGAAPSPGDANLLVATMTGQPILVDHGVTVDPVIEVASVDLHSGNLTFEGSVRVTGDVKNGMEIRATGDVEIAGAMESAHVVAGGDVVVRGGVVGAAAQRGAPMSARIESQGTVSARFMENVHVRAGRAILVEDAARECDLAAREQVVIGGSGRGGMLIGGATRAGQWLKVAVLGAVSGVRTLVEVGFDPALADQLAANDRARRKVGDDLLRVSQLAAYFARHRERDDGTGEKAVRTANQLRASLMDLQDEHARLLGQQQLLAQASIEVEKQLHGGVEVHLGGKIWRVMEDSGPGKLVLHEGQIVRV